MATSHTGAGLHGICEDDTPVKVAAPVTDADTLAVLYAMDVLVRDASRIRLGNALVAQLKANAGADHKTRNKRAAVIAFLRQLDRIERDERVVETRPRMVAGR